MLRFLSKIFTPLIRQCSTEDFGENGHSQTVFLLFF